MTLQPVLAGSVGKDTHCLPPSAHLPLLPQPGLRQFPGCTLHFQVESQLCGAWRKLWGQVRLWDSLLQQSHYSLHALAQDWPRLYVLCWGPRPGSVSLITPRICPIPSVGYRYTGSLRLLGTGSLKRLLGLLQFSHSGKLVMVDIPWGMSFVLFCSFLTILLEYLLGSIVLFMVDLILK